MRSKWMIVADVESDIMTQETESTVCHLLVFDDLLVDCDTG